MGKKWTQGRSEKKRKIYKKIIAIKDRKVNEAGKMGKEGRKVWRKT